MDPSFHLEEEISRAESLLSEGVSISGVLSWNLARETE